MDNSFQDHGPEGRTPAGDDWSPEFPHRALDRLAEQLERAHEVDPAEAAELVRMVAREAQRLRSTVVRLSVEKLSTADREARIILQDAVKRAEDLKALGLSTLEQRLDEADGLLVGLRNAFHAELGAARAATAARPTRHVQRDAGAPEDPTKDRK